MNITRHENVFSPSSLKQPIHVIGCGATGSNVAIGLAKLGIEDVTLYDFDVVEEHNIANQCFGYEHIGLNKAEALANTILRLTNLTYKVEKQEVVRSSSSGIYFVLTDTMSSRESIWASLIDKPDSLLIETRMGVEHGRVYTITPDKIEDINFYELTLYGDDEAEQSSCRGKITVGATAAILANLAIWKFICVAN